jgi:glycosyltransferase involved in cell wall biosynthesis
MRIASITAGAGGMFCGSCMKDNTLANALNKLGHQCLLIPCYTPMRLDEPQAQASPIFLGGLTMFLQQKYSWFRHIPRFLSRWLAAPWLLKQVSGSAVKIDAKELAPMTVSTLRGMEGNQKAEMESLIDWLASDFKPDVVLMTNVLLSGLIPELMRRLNVPIITTLQGDDIFLEELPEADRRECIELIRNNCAYAAGHIATCQFYADYMSNYLGLARESIQVVYPGIELEHFPYQPRVKIPAEPLTIGYLARIVPEKGFHVLVEALGKLHNMRDIPPWRFQAAGYCAGYRQDYLLTQKQRAEREGWGSRLEYIGEPDRAGKARFLQGLDVFSVPTTYQEPKGLYVLEAWAMGVPVVQPRHGSFPELIEASGGGTLFTPGDTDELANALAAQLRNEAARHQHGEAGRIAVHQQWSSQHMARETIRVIDQLSRT